MAVKDNYANRFFVKGFEDVAGTPKFVEVPTYSNAFAHEAFLVHRLEYFFRPADFDLLVAAGDMIACALTTSNNISTITEYDSASDPAVQDLCQVHFNLRGAAASFQFRDQPIVHDFTSLPGGGIMVPARPLFICINGESLASVVTAGVRGWFTRMELKADEYIDLVDAFRLIR